MKVMMAATFAMNGRFQGGIHAVGSSILASKDIFAQESMEIIPFNTCRISRGSSGMGGLNMENLKNFFCMYWDSVKEIRAAGADVFYMHSSIRLALLKDLLVLWHIKKTTKCRTILHVHYADYEKIMTGKGPLDQLILYLMKKYADAVVFLSRKTMEQFIARGLQAEKCSVIYNFSTLSFTDEQLQEKMRNREDTLQLLFVGSIDQRKGIFDVLECLTKTEQDLLLHVCGGMHSPEDQKRFEDYQEKLGDKIIFHGYISGEEKQRIFLQADALVLPSYGEGLPMVILEAFSAGNAVITTNVGAIPEVVEDKGGFVMEPGDHAALSKAMETYAASKELLREHQVHNGNISRDYALNAFIEQIMKVCRNV